MKQKNKFQQQKLDKDQVEIEQAYYMANYPVQKTIDKHALGKSSPLRTIDQFLEDQAEFMAKKELNKNF